MRKRQWIKNEKIEETPAKQLTTVSNKSEVIAEARNKGHTAHHASLVDICHRKNSELEPQVQKYRGRVVLRGHIVKDDSGSQKQQQWWMLLRGYPHRWVKRFVWSMDRFHSIYSIKWETSWRIYVVRVETYEKTADIQARSFLSRILDEIGKKC